MSKRKRPTSIKFREKHPREIGKFYRINDTQGGHPVRVYYSDPTNDIYYVQRFTRKKRRDRKLLLHNVNPLSDEKQWLVKKPEAVGFDEMVYESKYEKYRIHQDDEKTIKKYQKFNLKKKDERCE